MLVCVTAIISSDDIVHIDKMILLFLIQDKKLAALKAPADQQAFTSWSYIPNGLVKSIVHYLILQAINPCAYYNFINRSAACSKVASFFAKQKRSTLLLISFL